MLVALALLLVAGEDLFPLVALIAVLVVFILFLIADELALLLFIALICVLMTFAFFLVTGEDSFLFGNYSARSVRFVKT
jgi:hypothetical protein